MAKVVAVPGGFPLMVFSLAAATTHLLSSLTHVWPDDVWLEKADHLGIVVLILGTPYSLILVSPALCVCLETATLADC